MPPPPEKLSRPVDGGQLVPGTLIDKLDTPPEILESPESSFKVGIILADGQFGTTTVGGEV